MRIVAVNADRGISPDGSKGASIHLRSVLNAFVDAGHNVRLHTRRVPKETSGLNFEIREGVEVDDIATSILDSNADFVFERYSLNNLSGLLAASKTERPLALEVNAPLVLEATTHRPQTITPQSAEVESRLWLESALAFPVSSNLERLIRDTGRTGLIRTIPNGVDETLFQSPDSTLNQESPFQVAFLGHPKPWHGTAILADTFLELKRRGRDVNLVVIGGGEGAELLRQDFAAMGLSGQITVTGALSQADAIKVLQSTDISIAPYAAGSDFYFCPLKIIESLAAGIPLITSNVGDIEKLVGGFAEFTPCDNVEHFASKIEGLLADSERRRLLALEGRKHVLKNHTWANNVRTMVDEVSAYLSGITLS